VLTSAPTQSAPDSVDGSRSAMPKKVRTPRLAWALTGSGHFFTESLALIGRIPDVDLFVSRAAAEVVRMYRDDMSKLPADVRVFKDTTASAAPVGLFYHGVYHTLVVAPATSNTVAKCVYGISDNLATNVFAQAGKCRIPSIVFACDTAPELETMAPDGMVKVFPRRIDLDNVERLKAFEATTVVENLADLEAALRARLACLNISFS
jgi:dihydromethanopterin reductase (acceptor)